MSKNPGRETANIQLTYMTNDGEVTGPEDQVPAGNRRTYRVNDTIPEYSQFQIAVEAGPEFVMSVVDVIYTPIDENLASSTMIARYGLSDTVTLAVKAGVDVSSAVQAGESASRTAAEPFPS